MRDAASNFDMPRKTSCLEQNDNSVREQLLQHLDDIAVDALVVLRAMDRSSSEEALSRISRVTTSDLGGYREASCGASGVLDDGSLAVGPQEDDTEKVDVSRRTDDKEFDCDLRSNRAVVVHSSSGSSQRNLLVTLFQVLVLWHQIRTTSCPASVLLRLQNRCNLPR